MMATPSCCTPRAPGLHDLRCSKRARPRERLVIYLDVVAGPNGHLPRASEVVAGIQEGLPDEWWDPQDGDDFYLGPTWHGGYALDPGDPYDTE